ncbi:MAG: hypothetical protein Q4D71_15310, partial [Oscillospiraceae bacterium]|nr:hypothetical protein [Oscillospiraceae bacterium]
TRSHDRTNDESAAKRVIEKVAEEMFPYGCKIHWFIGLQRAEEIEFGVYHFVVDATITNMFNAKMDETLDIIIDMNNQEFISFDVY